MLRSVAWCCVLLLAEAEAQVGNDECSTAWPMQIGITQCTMAGSGFSGAYWLGGDLLNALPNLPYPTVPDPCTGYTGTVAAPANDRWYRVDLVHGAPTPVEFYASDTCHLSWWKGTCSNMMPIACYTILPNVPTLVTPWQEPIADTLFLQVSGIHLSGDLTFSACFAYFPGSVDPTPFVSPYPTPVTCAALLIQSTPVSDSLANDGEVSVVVLEGLAPHLIEWDDGSTSFMRSEMGPGAHVFTLIDSIGCMQSDTVFVGVDVSAAINRSQGSDHLAWKYDRTDHLLFVNSDLPEGFLIEVFDFMGRCLVTTEAWQTVVLELGAYPGPLVFRVHTNDRTRSMTERLPP